MGHAQPCGVLGGLEVGNDHHITRSDLACAVLLCAIIVGSNPTFEVLDRPIPMGRSSWALCSFFRLVPESPTKNHFE